ncbi:hypothetical protein CPL00229_CDS0178 [Escherichia phage vB_Eco_mar004NP2]
MSGNRCIILNVNYMVKKFYFYFKYKIPQGSHIELCPRQKVS